MHKSAVGHAIGKLLQVLGLVLLAPLAVGIYDYRQMSFSEVLLQPEILGFILAALTSAILGTGLVIALRHSRELQGAREGYAIVALGWVTLTFFSCLPLWFYFFEVAGSGWFTGLTDAYFEIMSGYTTTGATILTDIEAIPRSLLLLRALTHWLGGMGIITLAIVIFPSMGVSGYSMFRGEVTGPSKDKLRPRLAQSVSILWSVYVLFTAAETVLLWLGPMDFFEAVSHSFATMATGGFSTRNASVAAFDSQYVDWVITIFMYLAGVNFVLHFRALRGDFKAMYKNPEFKFFNVIVITSVLCSTAILYFDGLTPKAAAHEHFRSQPMTVEEFDEHYSVEEAKVNSLYGSFRRASFQAVSMVTATGFATADFDLWPEFITYLLVILMIFGGCAGSTAGGMKMIRIMLVLKLTWTVLRRMTQVRLVAPVKNGGQVVSESQLMNVLAFLVLYTATFVIIGLLMTLFVPDVTTAITCSITTIGNVGPGLAGVGAVENYSWIPLPGKWLLVFSMLLGRLEIFTVLIVFRPSVWRK